MHDLPDDGCAWHAEHIFMILVLGAIFLSGARQTGQFREERRSLDSADFLLRGRAGLSDSH